MANRVKELREERGWSLDELGARMGGVSRQQVWKLEKAANLRETWLTRLASAFGVPLSDVIAQPNGRPVIRDVVPFQQIAVDQIPVAVILLKGEVQAGAWREAAEWPPSEWEPVMIPQLREHRNLDLFALRVRGRSMDLVFAPDSLIVCASVFSPQVSIKDGDYVVVRRKGAHGFVEQTCKQLEILPNGSSRLWPRSSAPEFQEALVVSEPDEDEEVSIVAVVLSATRIFRAP